MRNKESLMTKASIFGLLLGIGLVVGAGNAQAQEGNAADGASVFNRCKACHTLEAGKNRVGPTLYGMFGREAGAVEGFRYSKALMESGIVWNEESLAQYLTDPRGTVPGNRMAFPGIKDTEDLTNLIAYLKDATQ